MKNETLKNNLQTYIFAGACLALALAAVVLIFRMVYEPPNITVIVEQPSQTHEPQPQQEPLPVIEPEANSHSHNREMPLEIGLLTVETPLTEMPLPAGPEPVAVQEPLIIPEEEIVAVAKTLKGECYDFELDDMRRVAWTITNRVDSEKWCNDVISVIERPGQFHGYRESNVPTDGNLAIAEEVLTAWYRGDYAKRDEVCDGKVYIYFYSRSGETVNIFREG